MNLFLILKLAKTAEESRISQHQLNQLIDSIKLLKDDLVKVRAFKLDENI